MIYNTSHEYTIHHILVYNGGGFFTCSRHSSHCWGILSIYKWEVLRHEAQSAQAFDFSAHFLGHVRFIMWVRTSEVCGSHPNTPPSHHPSHRPGRRGMSMPRVFP